MSNQKTLETEIIRVTKRLTEIDKRYRALQSEREGWLQKPDSPEKLSNLDELTGNLRIVDVPVEVITLRVGNRSMIRARKVMGKFRQRSGLGDVLVATFTCLTLV